MKTTRQTANGTSHYGHLFTATAKELTAIAGPPTNTGFDDSKVQKEWILETETNRVFTIYDYKEPQPITDDQTITWHIGARTREGADEATREIKAWLGILRSKENQSNPEETRAQKEARRFFEDLAAAGQSEASQEDLEEWLNNGDPADRAAIKEAILAAAEPTNLPTAIHPRFTEKDLRDILGDTQKEAAAEAARADRAETRQTILAAERYEYRKALNKAIDDLTATEKERDKAKETAEFWANKNAETETALASMINAEKAIEDLERKLEQAEDERDETQTDAEEEHKKRKEAEQAAETWERDYHDAIKQTNQAIDQRDQEHRRQRDEILDAFFKPGAAALQAARTAAGAGPWIEAVLRNGGTLTQDDRNTLLDLITTAKEVIDDGTPGNQDAWPTAMGPTPANFKPEAANQ